MRISDWSSDVCSSDLLDAHLPRIAPASALLGDIIEIEGDGPLGSMGVYVGNGRIFCYHELHDVPVIFQPVAPIAAWRSEEHTSELQSLMRLSYAVFCLKKKKRIHNILTSCDPGRRRMYV